VASSSPPAGATSGELEGRGLHTTSLASAAAAWWAGASSLAVAASPVMRRTGTRTTEQHQSLGLDLHLPLGCWRDKKWIASGYCGREANGGLPLHFTSYCWTQP
jgi:hypothetical protein